MWASSWSKLFVKVINIFQNAPLKRKGFWLSSDEQCSYFISVKTVKPWWIVKSLYRYRNWSGCTLCIMSKGPLTLAISRMEQMRHSNVCNRRGRKETSFAMYNRNKYCMVNCPLNYFALQNSHLRSKIYAILSCITQITDETISIILAA